MKQLTEPPYSSRLLRHASTPAGNDRSRGKRDFWKRERKRRFNYTKTRRKRRPDGKRQRRQRAVPLPACWCREVRFNRKRNRKGETRPRSREGVLLLLITGDDGIRVAKNKEAGETNPSGIGRREPHV
jgi:hypothetical protein